jgi:hypothetical protein
LFGPIYIDDEPMMPLSIPQATWRKGLGRSHNQIVKKEHPQRLNSWLIQSGKRATHGRAMGETLAAKERHKGQGKRV